MMMARAANKGSRGESEMFDIARSLVEVAQKLFPDVDDEELKRTCEAALDVAIDESKRN
ncbi:MAG: hypothetical protein VW802_08710 [Rhodospirillaceae bacterium]|jgi:hypothetical protein